MKKLFLIIGILLLLLTGGFLYFKYSVLKVKDGEHIESSSNPTDLSPRIKLKLQEMFRKATDSLYLLNINVVRADILASKLSLGGINITPDSSAVNRSEKVDRYRVKLDSIHIDGIGIMDLLSSKKLSLKSVELYKPVIDITRFGSQKSPSSPAGLNGNQFSIDKLLVEEGTLIFHDHSLPQRLEGVHILMQDILVDSSTANDDTRFLFAKKAEFSIKDFKYHTTDSLYLIRLGSISLAATGRSATLSNISVEATRPSQDFRPPGSARLELLEIKIPQIKFSGVGLKELMRGSILVEEAQLSGGKFNVFLDRSFPPRVVKQNNFPHQLIMQLKPPIAIRKMLIKNSVFTYTEYNPAVQKTGEVRFGNLNCSAENITNIKDRISKNHDLSVQASAQFMDKVPIALNFHFDLLHSSTGDFKMDLKVAGMDTSVLNMVSKPLGEFKVRHGTIQSGQASISGNIYKAGGKGLLLYKDLYLVGLKKDSKDSANYKKKNILSLFANIALIKNANPSSGNDIRTVDFEFKRGPYNNFFNLVWKSVLVAILKTIGLPEKLAYQVE